MSRLHRSACRCGLLLAAVLGSASAQAAVYTVTNASDSVASGSLRNAITAANASPDDDEIVFAGDFTILLQSPLPELQAAGGNLVITGNGADKTIIDGAGQHQVFYAKGQSGLRFTLRDLTVRNGNAANRPGSNNNGGGVFFDGGSGKVLTIDRVRFHGNIVSNGGAAIYAEGQVTITNSAFHDNQGRSNVWLWNGPVVVANTTIHNDASSHGLRIKGGSAGTNAWLINTTVLTNPASAGVQLEDQITASLTNCVLTGGSAAELQRADLVLTGNATIDTANSRNNLIGKQYFSGPANGAPLQHGINGNLIDVDARLAPLGNYGGPTPTMALLPGSPALNAGTADGDIDTTPDQRGVARVGAPDIGAFESQGFTVTYVSGSGQSTNTGRPFAAPLVAKVAANVAIEPVADGRLTFSAPASGPGAVFDPAVAVIGSDGLAQTLATAGASAGGPYSVLGTLPGLPAAQAAVFTLTNLDPCAGISFPYLLAGADNAARVANLRLVIECANANATADVIDLGAHTLLFSDAPYVGTDGASALPLVTGGLTLKNGTLQRAGAAPPFRFLSFEPGESHLVDGVTFQAGSAPFGGAIVSRATLEVRNSRFEGNRADDSGGAIHANVELRVRDSLFRYNRAQQGGAVRGEGKIDVRATVFDDNMADVSGGGLSARQATTRDSRFERNQAESGGAIATADSDLADLVVVRTHFVDNKAPDGRGDENGFGGAILYRGSAYVTGSSFSGNEAYSGGALYCPGIPLVQCHLDVANSLFTHNTAMSGSVYANQSSDADSKVTFTNVTLVDNEGIGYGSGVRLFQNYAGDVIVRNSIVWNNRVMMGAATFQRSLLDVQGDGDDNLFDRDPRFVDAANGDYRLAEGSAAVDAGDNGFVVADRFDANDNGDVAEDAPDRDNLPRRHDDAGMVDTGAGTAPIVDLGAYERQADSTPAGITVVPVSGLVTTESGGTATFTVVLDTQPNADVEIGLSSSDTTEGTVSPASLTFTPSNWSMPQTVTVTGVDDSEVDGDVEYFIITAPAASLDANYDGLDAGNVSVTNLDDDVAPVPGAHLSARKSVLQPGTTTQPVVYEIVVTNSGAGDQVDDPASDELVDVLPPELALRGATASGGSMATSGNTVRWNGALAAGASVNIRIEADVTATQAATIVNQARVHYDGDGDGRNESQGLSTDPAVPGNEVPTAFHFDGDTAPVPGAHLSARKSVLQPGTTTQPVVYEIVVTNIGAGDQVDDPASDELVDVLPPELALRGATASGGSVATSGNTVRWNGALAAGASVMIRIEADVTATQAATIVNQARVHYDGDGDGRNESQGRSTDPAVPGNEVPTAFRFEGAVQPVAPTPVPANYPAALIGLLLIVLLLGGREVRRRGRAA